MFKFISYSRNFTAQMYEHVTFGNKFLFTVVIKIRQLPRPILAPKGQSQCGKDNLGAISAWPTSL